MVFVLLLCIPLFHIWIHVDLERKPEESIEKNKDKEQIMQLLISHSTCSKNMLYNLLSL